MNSETDVDKELKMAQIKHLEQMVAESQATVEKMREEAKLREEERKERELQREAERKIREEEWKIREAEFKEKSLERDIYIAKMRAETSKIEKESKYAMWIPIVVCAISGAIAIAIAIYK